MELASKIGQSEKCSARIKGEETANLLRSCRVTVSQHRKRLGDELGVSLRIECEAFSMLANGHPPETLKFQISVPPSRLVFHCIQGPQPEAGIPALRNVSAVISSPRPACNGH